MKEQPQKKEVEGGRGRMTGGRTMTRRLAKLYYVGQEISGEWRDDDGTGLRIVKGGNKNSSRRAFKCRDARACVCSAPRPRSYALRNNYTVSLSLCLLAVVFLFSFKNALAPAIAEGPCPLGLFRTLSRTRTSAYILLCTLGRGLAH